MRELFASDNFNFQEFLASHSGTPLEESILSLEKVSKTVQNELYELINGDLVHFKNVLKEVCDIDIEAVKQFRHEFEAEKVITEVTTYIKLQKVLNFNSRKIICILKNILMKLTENFKDSSIFKRRRKR